MEIDNKEQKQEQNEKQNEEQNEEQENIITYNEIHMYKQARGRNTDTIIVGLKFNNEKNAKSFISSTKKRFGISGCQKMIESLDKENPVFVFTGDLRDKIINTLVDDYKCIRKAIKKFG
jgi:RNase H-fold protein (predicted Holliday junction resolvase)